MGDRTCTDRIASQLREAREFDIGMLLDAASGDLSRLDDMVRAGYATEDASSDDLAEIAQETLWDYPLEVSTSTVLKVLISTGGPADYLTCEIERTTHGWERTSSVSYHFAGWFGHAEITLPDDSPLTVWMDQFAENHYDA